MSAYVLANGQRVYPAFVLNDADGGGIVTPPASFRLADGTQVMGIVLVDENGEIAPAGVASFPYDETFDPFFVGTTVGATGTNSLVLVEVPGRPTELTVSQIKLYIGTSSGNIDVGVYSFDGTTFTLLSSSGSTAAGAATAVQTLTLGAAQTRAPGDRWFLGVVADNGTVTFGRASTQLAAITTQGNRAVIKINSFPLATNAASFTTAALTGGAAVVPWLRGIA